MNRYFQRNRYAQFNPMSLQELMMIPSMKQQEHNQMLETSLSLQQDEQKVIDKDQEIYSQGLKEINSQIDGTINELQERGVSPKMTKNIIEARNNVKSFMSPTGLGGQALASMQARQQYAENINKAVQDGTITREDAQRHLIASDTDYRGISEGDIYGGRTMQKSVNVQKEIAERLQKMEPSQRVHYMSKAARNMGGYDVRLNEETGAYEILKNNKIIKGKDKEVLREVGRLIMENDPEISSYLNFMYETEQFVRTPGEDGSYGSITNAEGESIPITDPRQLVDFKKELMLEGAVGEAAFMQETVDSSYRLQFVPKHLMSAHGLEDPSSGTYTVDPGTSRLAQTFGGWDKVNERLSELDRKKDKLTSNELVEYETLSKAKIQTEQYIQENYPEKWNKLQKEKEVTQERLRTIMSGGDINLEGEKHHLKNYGRIREAIEVINNEGGENRVIEFIDLVGAGMPAMVSKAESISGRTDLNKSDMGGKTLEILSNYFGSQEAKSILAEAATPEFFQFRSNLSKTFNRLFPKGVAQKEFNKEAQKLFDEGRIRTEVEYSPNPDDSAKLNKMKGFVRNNVNPKLFEVVSLDNKSRSDYNDKKNTEDINDLKSGKIVSFAMSSHQDNRIGLNVSYIPHGESEAKNMILMPKEGSEYYSTNSNIKLIDYMFGENTVTGRYYKDKMTFRDIVTSHPDSESNYNILDVAKKYNGVNPEFEPKGQLKMVDSPQGAGYLLMYNGQYITDGEDVVPFPTISDVIRFTNSRQDAFYNINAEQ